MKKNTPFLLCFCFLLACQPTDTDKQVLSTQDAFFDLKNYFNEQSKILTQRKGFTKTTQINGEKETHTFDTLDFSRELDVFMNADINRIAWFDQYQVDSVFSEAGTLSSISYQALKPELQTQKVLIAFEQKEPSFIEIHKLMENALMNASMQLEYRPNQSYRIQSNQKLRISEEREMIVEVLWE